MKSKHSLHKSSILVSIPCIVLAGILCLLSAFYGNRIFSFSLATLFLLSLVSRTWADVSAMAIDARISVSTRDIFPGQKMEVEVRIKNNKFCPVAWLDLYMPLSRQLSLVPEDVRVPEQWEIIHLANSGASTKLVGTKKCGRLLWYEEASFPILMEAKHRGVSSLDSWMLDTGDGFGLSESMIHLSDGGVIAVYPRIIEVDTAPFLRNLWNSNTGTHGVMEDLTVIRSTRDYQTTDSLKHINWRLLARALPLTVNLYEDILPKSIHILFDGESFSGSAPHREEMEETLSVIASELMALQEHEIKCYLSICKNGNGKAVCISPEEGIRQALHALAMYEPLAQKLDIAGTGVVIQNTVFDVGAVLRTTLAAGHFFYFTYDSARVDSELLENIDNEKVTIVSCLDSKEDGTYEHLSLGQLRRSGRNDQI